jgi:hypothetical protein
VKTSTSATRTPSFIDKAVEEGFINPAARCIIVSAPTAQELMEKLEVGES